VKRLSIIVPALDEAAGIAAALGRLGPMRGRGVEVIVVDGGSTDRTRELAAPLADKVIASPRGRAAQMNAGARAAAGDVLLFLHADCALPGSADVEVLQGLARGSRRWGRFDVRIASPSRLLALVGFMMNWRSRLTGIATGDQAIFATREAFAATGGFPEQPLMEDIALSGALKRLSRPLCLAGPIATSARRWERGGTWRTIALMWRLRLAYFAGADPAALARAYRPESKHGVAGARATVIVFARAPIPGEAKTRLIPSLGAEGAARLHAALAHRALEVAVKSALGPVELWTAGPAGHAFFAECALRHGVSLHEQRGADLGVRMDNAFREALARSDRVIVIGTDCPDLGVRDLHDAARALAEVPAVFQPALDGGYVLVGLRDARVPIFGGIAWGTGSVMAGTREKLRAAGLQWRELEPRRDIDRPEDLAHLPAALAC
jgi:rSAM/selenodomain-associated transferase 2/rSAM/selenodomain-associated transferase 1